MCIVTHVTVQTSVGMLCTHHCIPSDWVTIMLPLKLKASMKSIRKAHILSEIWIKWARVYTIPSVNNVWCVCECVCACVWHTSPYFLYDTLMLNHTHTNLHALPIHLHGMLCTVYTYSDSASSIAMHILLCQSLWPAPCALSGHSFTWWYVVYSLCLSYIQYNYTTITSTHILLHRVVRCVQSVSFLHTVKLYNYHFYTHTPPPGGMLCTDQIYCLLHHP